MANKKESQSQQESGFSAGKTKINSKGIVKAVEFIKEILGKEGDIIKAAKTDRGWEVEVEIIEQSEYMKKITAKPVYDRNVYCVILDQNFDIVSYERRGQKPFGAADNKTAE